MIKLEKFSYNFAEEVLNSRKYLKDEIEYVIENTIKHYESEGLDKLTSKNLNKSLRQSFEDKRWDSEPYVFEDEELPDQPKAKLDFLDLIEYHQYVYFLILMQPLYLQQLTERRLFYFCHS